MNIELTEEHIAVRDAARDFAQNVLKPGVIERDEKQQFPTEEIKQLGELGFLGMMKERTVGLVKGIFFNLISQSSSFT